MTGIVAVFSEFLVSSIDEVCVAYNISKVFVGVILIPIVGNATEHMTAVTVAYKNRMELAMGIAVGSATQVCMSSLSLSRLCVFLSKGTKSTKH